MNTASIRLRGLNGPTVNRTFESRGKLRLGRLRSLEVCLDDSSVSRTHAELISTAQGWVLRDLGSTNGTFLNTARLGTPQETLVRAGDVVQCGTVSFMVEAAVVGRESGATDGAEEMALRQSARHTLEEATALLAARPEHAAAAMLWLARAGRKLGATGSLGDYLHGLLWEAAEALGASRGTVMVMPSEKTGGQRAQADFDLCGRPSFWPWARSLAWPALEGCALLYHARSVQGVSDTGADAPGSLLCVPLLTSGESVGVVCLGRDADQSLFEESDLLLAEGLALAAAGTVAGLVRLFEKQEEQLLQSLRVLADLTTLRDEGAGGRARRVTEYALLLAEELELPEVQKRLLRSTAPLCDLGRIGVSDFTLSKAGPLTETERAQVRASVARAATLLESAPALAPMAGVVRGHRERWDGTGYPYGLAGEAIPQAARVLAVADAFDAMTTDRPYRGALTPEEAFTELRRGAGSQFDPACVDALLRLRPRLEESLLEGRQAGGTLNREQLGNVLESLGLEGSPPLRGTAGGSVATTRRPSPKTTFPDMADTTPDRRLLTP